MMGQRHEAATKVTLKRLAQEALDVQNVCNLSGVVHGWSRALAHLHELLPDLGTEGRNRHPINQLWAAKVHDLAGMGSSDMNQYCQAYHAVKAMAEG